MDKQRTLAPATNIAPALLSWFDKHGRHDLPWQGERLPYHVWLSEIMLQQTQVNTVIPYFERFIQRFPNIESLADAPLDDVLSLWTGLGYYARARNLHKAAQDIVNVHQGEFPHNFEDVIKLPGIGRSTAGAILAQSRGQRHPILDGNVKRVLTRLYVIEGWPGERKTEQQLWQLAEQLTPQDRIVDYTQAIMDLGATVCKRSKPACTACPLSANCLAYHSDTTSNYPTPKRKKGIPTRNTQMLILANEEEKILLYKRPPSGIWGGLWSFPETDEQQDLSYWCQQQFNCEILETQILSAFRHTFSHFHLDITPIFARVKNGYQVMDSNDLAWYNIDLALQLGIATPIKKLLSDAQVRTLLSS